MINITELFRKLANIVRVGTISDVDYEKQLVRVQIGELKTGWLRFLTLRAGSVRIWSPPSLDEQVVVISIGGELKQGLVIPALFQNAFPAPSNSADVHCIAFKDDAVIEYNTATHALSITLPAAGSLTLTAPGGVTINGNITVTGTIHSTGDQIAGVISEINHVHGGVEGGSSNTGAPH
jgi:phage baseplate assembly protein V